MYKVIIVEDDPMVAAINRQYLQAAHTFCVEGEFRNGKDALDYLENHQIDLAIVDYYMPLMDGRQFLEACQRKGLSCQVIMITAANSPHELESVLQYGIIDYLVKPFTYERFGQAIQKYLNYKEILTSRSHLNQQEIDRLLASAGESSGRKILDKGLQTQTLHTIRAYLEKHSDTYIGNNEIASAVNLSRITVRRYINFLLENGEITSQVDYATGGRPSIKYKMLS